MLGDKHTGLDWQSRTVQEAAHYLEAQGHAFSAADMFTLKPNLYCLVFASFS